MDRTFYLDLARAGKRFPIGAHLVLSERPDHHSLLTDGAGLGEVLVETADRFKTPLALPLMDLMVEKAELLGAIGIPAAQVDTYHFESCPREEVVERVRSALESPLTPRMRANCDAIRHVAARRSDLLPAGMAIGPFSLMTKLLADPITPVFMSGAGVAAADDDEVRAVERALEMAVLTVQRAIRLQVQAGARVVCVCEPAANKVYLSPRQIEGGSDVFERLVMVNLRRIKATLDELGADLILHDCGELTDAMVRDFAALDAAILSLGSSRVLWEDARLVPRTTVLYGNLPTKSFYSDSQMPLDRVAGLARELIRRMGETGHPFILGSECDVLSVPGSEATIKAKVDRMMTARV